MKPNLKTLKVKNFKVHENLQISFGKLSEVYGDNGKGKTSVGEAIKFALFPKIGDVSKIKKGADMMEVVLVMETEDKKEIFIEASIDRQGKLKRKLLFDGVANKQPAGFLKEFVCHESFNPRDLLEPGKRDEKLLAITPLKVEEEDLKKFPIHEREKIDCSKHAVIVLAQVDEDLRNTRLHLGRDKDRNKKSLESLNLEILKNKKDFEENFGEVPTINSEEIFKIQGSVETELAQIKQDKKLAEDLIKIRKDNIKQSEISIQESEGRIKELEKLIQEENTKITEHKAKKQADAEDEKTQVEKIKALDEKEKETIKKEVEIKEKVLQAKALRTIDEKLLLKKKYEKDLEESESKWKVLEDSIVIDFPILRRKVLKPLLEKVPNLDFVSGKLCLDGVFLDELSESETIRLAVKLMEIENKTSFLIVDEAESLDNQTIKEINWLPNTILLRVGENPIGENWKSNKV